MYVFAVIDGAALRIDDRLRVAKERREEAEKQQGESAIRLSAMGSQFLFQMILAVALEIIL